MAGVVPTLLLDVWWFLRSPPVVVRRYCGSAFASQFIRHQLNMCKYHHGSTPFKNSGLAKLGIFLSHHCLMQMERLSLELDTARSRALHDRKP
eukprot:6434230-Amphidinium_carterae.1